MTKLVPLALAAAVLLAGCGQQTAQPAANAAAAAESGYIGKVRALTPAERKLVLYRAILKGGGQRGEACQGVTEVNDMPATKTGQPLWRAVCSEGSEWLIALADNGTATVTGLRDNP